MHVGLLLTAVSTAGALVACTTNPSARSGSAIAIGGTTTTPDTTDVPLTTDSVPVETAPVETEAPTTAEPTTTVPLECLESSNVPTLVAAEETGYDTVQTQEGLGAADKRAAVLFTSGGAVATQFGSGSTRSIEYRIGPKDGGGPKGKISKAVLFDIVPTSQGPAILYGAINTSVDPAVTSTLALFDIGSETSTTLADLSAESYSFFRASASNGRVLASARTPSGNVTKTWALDAKGEIPRFSLNQADGDSRQFVGPALLNNDGSKMLLLAGPDPSLRASKRKGDWVLYLLDAENGDEIFRLKLGPSSDLFKWLDWDGSWAVISRGYGKPAVVVHTTEGSPEAQNLCNSDRTALVSGIVSVVRRTTISTDSGIA